MGVSAAIRARYLPSKKGGAKTGGGGRLDREGYEVMKEKENEEKQGKQMSA